MLKIQSFKYILLVFVFLFFSACASKTSVYNVDDRSLTLGKKTNTLRVDFTNPLIENHSAIRCVFNSYTLLDKNKEYGDLFIESISLDSKCNWNGLPSSFFESNFKAVSNIKYFETIEEFEIDNYVFKTFRVNKDSYVNMIFTYSGDTNRFIVDYYGRLFDKLVKIYKPTYKNKYFAKKRYIGNYNDSLARKSYIQDYFEVEKWSIKPNIGIRIIL